MSWYVYIARCADDTLYTGIARNLERRMDEHNGLLPRAARYTRGRRPVRLMYTETWASRAEATRREIQIKQLTRAAKLALINNNRRKRYAGGLHCCPG